MFVGRPARHIENPVSKNKRGPQLADLRRVSEPASPEAETPIS